MKDNLREGGMLKYVGNESYFAATEIYLSSLNFMLKVVELFILV